MPRLFCTLLLVVCAAVSVRAHATAVYNYKADEYVTVDKGRAPNGRLSIAAHGEGEFGSDNFHLYMMAEPAHKVLAALPAIGSDNILDSGAGAFYAHWSPDSRHVIVTFRNSRHEMSMPVYEISGGKPYLLNGPSLFNVVTKGMPEDGDDYGLRYRVSEPAWIGPTQFRVTEYRIYGSTGAVLTRALGPFGKAAAKPYSTSKGDNDKPYDWYMVDFSAEATAEIVPGRRYKINDLKPGPFNKLKELE